MLLGWSIVPKGGVPLGRVHCALGGSPPWDTNGPVHIANGGVPPPPLEGGGGGGNPPLLTSYFLFFYLGCCVQVAINYPQQALGRWPTVARAVKGYL